MKLLPILLILSITVLLAACSTPDLVDTSTPTDTTTETPTETPTETVDPELEVPALEEEENVEEVLKGMEEDLSMLE